MKGGEGRRREGRQGEGRRGEVTCDGEAFYLYFYSHLLHLDSFYNTNIISGEEHTAKFTYE